GSFMVANVTQNTFQLVGSTGNGGYVSGGTWTVPILTVQNGASVALESNVGHIDSVTGQGNQLQVAAPANLDGDGYNNLGALHNVSGINTYTTKLLAAPTQAAIVGGSGGNLVNGTTYFYVVTAVDGYGESLASNEQFFQASVTNKTAMITWSQVPGA